MQLTLYEFKKKLLSEYKATGKLPTSSELQEYFKAPAEHIARYMEFVREKNFVLKDADGNEYIDLETYGTEKQPESTEPKKTLWDMVTIKGVPVKPEKYKTPMLKNNKMITALRWIMLFIGVGATYMSIHFTYIWFLSFLNPLRAGIFSVIMVLFGVISFEIVALLWKRSHRIPAGVFGVLCFTVICFSMVSTIAGQYTNRMKQIAESNKANASEWQSVKEYENYKEQKAGLEKRISDLRSEDARITQLLLNYQTIEQIEAHKKVYNQLTWQKTVLSRNMNNVLKQLDTLEGSKPAAVQDASGSNFYEWVAKVLNVNADSFQFWLSLFPALFIDLVAPLSIAVFLFVRGEYV